MTAHIQYPQLDNTEFTATDGSKVILPATMSRKILTDLLRTKMGFKGVIATDALNMAGIAHYFDETEAVIQTFAAGSDIALMPIAIRSPADIVKVSRLIDDVAHAVQQGRLDRAEIAASAARITALKNQYKINQTFALPLEQAIAKANTILGAESHRLIEQELADKAIVQLKNQGVLPLSASPQNIHLLMPDQTKCMALTLALKTRLAGSAVTCSSLANASNNNDAHLIEQAQVVLAADITPDQSLVELGGMDDIKSWRERAPKEQQITRQLAILQAAKAQGKSTIFVSLRTPYNAAVFAEYADVILATFSYNLNKTEYVDDYGRQITQYEGAIYNALADILTGKKVASGTLPVSVDL
jgi:beta-N-acetylhexosaminidase